MRIINFLRSRIRKFINEEIWIEDYKKMGMKIGNNCSIQPGVIFDYSHCWLINIGNNVTIAPQAYLLAHDASTKRSLRYTKIGSINIEDNVFIGAKSLIMPGVTIGRDSIIGANSVVTKSVPSGEVVSGNPAKVLCSVEEYLEKQQKILDQSLKYDISYTIKGKISDDKKHSMYNDLIEKIGFVE